MNILFVDDEEGIREGSSSYLRLKGHVVRSAASVAEALGLMADAEFDLVVSDWRLGDELAVPVVEAADCPCIVISGFPEEVASLSQQVHVLAKPLPMDQLLSRIRELDPHESESSNARSDADWDWGLPIDSRDRIRLVLALAGESQTEARLTDDGIFITLQVPWAGAEIALEQIERLGGDHRVLAGDSGPLLEYRLRRDGCPDGFAGPIQPHEDWPMGVRAVAIDLHLERAMSPADFLDLVDRCNRAEAEDREICLLNVPTHLSLFLDALGRTGELPKRRRAGPCLPKVLSELWG